MADEETKGLPALTLKAGSYDVQELEAQCASVAAIVATGGKSESEISGLLAQAADNAMDPDSKIACEKKPAEFIPEQRGDVIVPEGIAHATASDATKPLTDAIEVPVTEPVVTEPVVTDATTTDAATDATAAETKATRR